MLELGNDSRLLTDYVEGIAWDLEFRLPAGIRISII